MDAFVIEDYELDEDNERDSLIIRLNEVNSKLFEKLQKLEDVVEQTVQKAYQATRSNAASHREWEKDADDDIKSKNKAIASMSSQISHHKKTIAGLKVQLASIASADRMIDMKNQLRDTDRQKKALELDVATMEKNIRHQQKYLNQMAGDTDYEDKIRQLKDTLEDQKKAYKQTQKELRKREIPQREQHERLISLEEEHSKLRRQLIDIKNGTQRETVDDTEDAIKAIQQSQEAYKKAQKNDEKRHKQQMKKLQDQDKEIQDQIDEMKSMIEEKEKNNKTQAKVIKENKKLLKETEEQKRKEEEELRKLEEEEAKKKEEEEE